MRIVNGVMLVVFLLSCAVQYNDPDALLWIAYYGYAVVVTAMALAGNYTVLAPIGAVAYVIGWAYYMPGWDFDTVMLLTEPKMSSENVELAREAFGLLISGAYMAVLSVVWYRRKIRKPAEEVRHPEEPAST